MCITRHTFYAAAVESSKHGFLRALISFKTLIGYFLEEIPYFIFSLVTFDLLDLRLS